MNEEKIVEDLTEIINENKRLKNALQHIADGNISPSIDFARKILEGATVKEAHAYAVDKWD